MFGNLRQLKITLAFLASGSIVHANNSEGIEYFETHIRPLFVEHCYECHSADAKELKANLYLDSRTGWQIGGDSGPAIIPGKPEDSLLLNAISYTNSDLEMPPKNRLPDSKIQHLKSWIAMGAPAPRENKAKTTTIRIIVIIFHVPHSLSDEASGGFIDNERDGLKLSALNEFGVPVITSSIYKIAILNI